MAAAIVGAITRASPWIPPTKTTFWLFNEYAMSRGTAIPGEDGRWATQYGSFHLNLPLAVSLASFTAEPQAGSGPPGLGDGQRGEQHQGFNLDRDTMFDRVGAVVGLRAVARSRQHAGLHLHLRRPGRPAQPDLLVLAGGRQPRRRDDAAWAGQRDGASVPTAVTLSEVSASPLAPLAAPGVLSVAVAGLAALAAAGLRRRPM